jgi:hypothetical protein
MRTAALGVGKILAAAVEGNRGREFEKHLL